MNKNIDLVADAFQGCAADMIKRREGDRFVYVANSSWSNLFIENAHKIYKHLELFDFPYMPKVINYKIGRLEMQFIETEAITDQVKWGRECAKMLIALKKAGVRHGDLTDLNIIVNDNRPIVVDFQQSKRIGDPGPDKRPEGDSFHLWKAAVKLSPDIARTVRKWEAIRNNLPAGWHSVNDVGCGRGQFGLFLRSEKLDFNYTGQEHNPDLKREGEAINGEEIHLVKPWPNYLIFNCDVVLMMSVYAHVANHHGRDRADRLFAEALGSCEVMFFETQLHGDGPGPSWFANDDNVYSFLSSRSSPASNSHPCTRLLLSFTGELTSNPVEANLAVAILIPVAHASQKDGAISCNISRRLKNIFWLSTGKYLGRA